MFEGPAPSPGRTWGGEIFLFSLLLEIGPSNIDIKIFILIKENLI